MINLFMQILVLNYDKSVYANLVLNYDKSIYANLSIKLSTIINLFM